MHVVLWLKRASGAQGIILSDPANACQGEITVTAFPWRRGENTNMHTYTYSLVFTTCALLLKTIQPALPKCMHLAENIFLNVLIYMWVKLLWCMGLKGEWGGTWDMLELNTAQQDRERKVCGAREEAGSAGRGNQPEEGKSRWMEGLNLVVRTSLTWQSCELYRCVPLRSGVLHAIEIHNLLCLYRVSCKLSFDFLKIYRHSGLGKCGRLSEMWNRVSQLGAHVSRILSL